MNSLLIRTADYPDISQIAKVHIQSWQETYPGIMPAKRIAALNQDSSMSNWQRSLDTGSRVFVALVQNTIVGFVAGGENRSTEHSETGVGDACECELAAIYLLQEHQGKGIGKALFNRFVRKMQEEGFHSMVVWVAEKNPSTGFYTALRGELVDRKILLICEEAIPVVAYKYII